MKIILIRHGKPEFELKGKARAKDVSAITRNYDQSGISETPPEDARQVALNCHAVVCSDLLRSLQSANALGFKNIDLSDRLFREVALPHFKAGSIVLPVITWAVVLRVMSLFGFSKNGESLTMAKKRAKLAASALIELAHEHDRILFVGHGFINYFIAKELSSSQWVGPAKPRNGYWEYAEYRQIL